MTRVIIQALIAAAILLSLACATGEAADPRDYILEGAQEVLSTNYRTQLTAAVVPPGLLALRRVENTEAFRADLRYSWDSEAFNLGQDAGRVEQVVSVSGRGGTYNLVSGDFDFDGIEDFFRKNAYSANTYWHERDIYVWHGTTPDAVVQSIILIPDGGFYYFGDGRTLVEAFLAALDKGVGFTDDSSELGKLLNRTDSSSFTSAIRADCSMLEDLPLNGCLGLSWSAKGGDETSTQLSYAVLFGNPKNAQSAAPEIEADIEREMKDSGQDYEFTELEVSGDLVTFNLTLSE